MANNKRYNNNNSMPSLYLNWSENTGNVKELFINSASKPTNTTDSIHPTHLLRPAAAAPPDDDDDDSLGYLSGGWWWRRVAGECGSGLSLSASHPSPA